MSEWRGTFRDRIVNEGKLLMPPWLDEATVADIAPMLRALVQELSTTEVFAADNVSEYLYAGTDQEDWDAADFPCVAPPFPTFFIEWGRPTRVVSEEFGVIESVENVPAHTGWLFIVEEHESGEGWNLRGTLLMDIDDRDPIAELVGTGIMWPGLVGDYHVNADGSLDELLPVQGIYGGVYGERRKEDLAGVFGAMSVLVFPALLALSFVNCRNVPRRKVEPPPRLVRRDLKRGREPHRGYHVLEIGPMQRTLAAEGQAETHGLKRALHVCRGHFKTYTEDAPLLGRAVGTWWWGPQVRGSAEAGVSPKDYRVRPDEEGTR